jgi:hypothetical protein
MAHTAVGADRIVPVHGDGRFHSRLLLISRPDLLVGQNALAGQTVWRCRLGLKPGFVEKC